MDPFSPEGEKMTMYCFIRSRLSGRMYANWSLCKKIAALFARGEWNELKSQDRQKTILNFDMSAGARARFFGVFD